jgi:hypothetical protein
MPMLSSQEEMAMRREVQRNDQLVRQATTMHTFADADAAIAQGRFTQVNAANVIGSKANVAASYPACSPALAVQLPDVMPLGYRIDDLEPCSAQGNSGDAAVVPSTVHSPGLMSERAASPLSRLRRF